MKLLKLLVILLSSTLILSCSLTIPDEEVCVTLDDGSAFCDHTVSDISEHVDKEEWAAIQTGRFSMSAESFAAFQTFIESACEFVRCSAEQKRIQGVFLMKMRGMNEKAVEKN